MAYSQMKSLRLICAALLGLVLVGCSSPPTRDAMTPTGISTSRQNPYSVHVLVSGGSETGPVSGSDISDVDLRAAIEAAVTQSKVFSTVVPTANGDYDLSVRVISLSRPLFGATFTVEMEAAWTLIKVSDRSVKMRKSVKSSGVATVGDAFVGASRIRMAVENAARENIRQGVQALAEVSL